MSSDSTSLTLMARTKMHSPSGGKDKCSLHRWVLLKNCLSVCPAQSVINPMPSDSMKFDHCYSFSSTGLPDELIGETGAGHGDSFLFPDAGNLVSTSHTGCSEAQWLDTLLKRLVEDEDEDELGESDVISSAIAGDEDDEDAPLSPLTSPMASSDDLHTQMSPYLPALPSIRCTAPCPHYQPPLVHPYPGINPSFSLLPAPYEDPLPYHNPDDAPNYSVPDALLEDTSDDESDVPSTPSSGRSSASLALCETHPLSPTDSPALPHAKNLYFAKDTLFHPFDVDPLPFSNEHHSSNNPYRDY